MYNFFLNIWYYFVGKPREIVYIKVEPVPPEDLKFGLMDNGDYLYQYFIEEIVYFFWGDFLEGRPGRQIETYLEKILIATRWNQVETGFEIFINLIDRVIRYDDFYTWDFDWGDELVLAVEDSMAFDFLTNMLMWYLIGFFYVFYIYWSNYFTFSKTPDRQNFFDTFHQTNDMYFDYYQQHGKESFNIFEDGFHIIPSGFDSDYDWMSGHDNEYEYEDYMDFSDICEHPSLESDRLLDYMFDAKAYDHFTFFESLLDAIIVFREGEMEWYKDKQDIFDGFESTSAITLFWWDPFDSSTYTKSNERYIWQYKESKERNKHPHFFYHPLEHYGGSVDPFIMIDITWDYEPWLEDNFNVVIMGEVLVEELLLSLVIEDADVEEFVDEIEEENDYDYMDAEGMTIEENEVDQLVSMPFYREYELVPLFDDVGNKSIRYWIPEIDWNPQNEPNDFDWEDWEELFDEGSDGMFSDNDAVLEHEYLVSVLNQDVYFGNLNYDVYGGGFLFADINDELMDVYIDYSMESSLLELAEGALPFGRNEERLFDFDEFALDYAYVTFDRLYRNVSIWEFGNSIDYMLGSFLLDVYSLTKEAVGLLETSAYQLDILYRGLLDIHGGKVPEYPIRWNARLLLYEVYNLETHLWVKLEDALRYLILDLDLIYKNRKYILGYSPELLIKWSLIGERSYFMSFLLWCEGFIYYGAFEYYFSFLLFFDVFLRSVFEFFSSLYLSLYSFLKDNLSYKHADVLFTNSRQFLKGEYYSNFFGLELLAYDKDYSSYIFKNRCNFRLDLETVSLEEDLYPSWWVRQGIIDLDYYWLQLNSYDPRNPVFYWYDRAEIMTYPDVSLSSCGNLDMVEINDPVYLLSTRKVDPDWAFEIYLDLPYQDFPIFAGMYERDPSQWLTDTILLDELQFLPFYYSGLFERRRYVKSLFIRDGRNPFEFDT